MTVNRKPTGIAVSIPVGVAWGAVAAIGTTLGGAALTAKLIDGQVLDWNHSGYAVLIILLASAWAGALVSAGRIKRQRTIICLASGVVYFMLLLISTALFFGGQYSGVGETALLIFCGSVLGLFTKFGGKTRRNRGKSVYHNR